MRDLFPAFAPGPDRKLFRTAAYSSFSQAVLSPMCLSHRRIYKQGHARDDQPAGWESAVEANIKKSRRLQRAGHFIRTVLAGRCLRKKDRKSVVERTAVE